MMPEIHALIQSASSTAANFVWALQFALGLGVALGAAALAIGFQRPAIRVLALASGLSAASGGLIWLSLSAQALGLPTWAGSWVRFVVFVTSPWLLFLLQLQMVNVVSHRTERVWPPWQLVAGVGGGAAGVGALLVFTDSPGSQSLIPVFSSSAALIAHLLLAALAFGRRSGMASPTALRVLGVAFALLSIRSAVNLSTASRFLASGEALQFDVAASAALLVLLVLAYVLQLVAALEDERTAVESAGERLRSAEASLAASARLESLGRMASGIAHDFNNLLAVISLSAQSARATLAAPSARADAGDAELADIESASRRAQELTAQLLAFARHDPQQVSRFDVTAQVDKLKPLLHRVVGNHSDLQVSGAAAPLLVEMDASQFDQVVMNLVVNARDAAPRGGTIAVQVSDATSDAMPRGKQSSPPHPGFARVTVTDSGPGIPPGVLPHIFEPFFTTKKPGEGTGLGLATCDAIVRKLGGRIDVDSAVGKGARFDVLFPKAQGM